MSDHLRGKGLALAILISLSACGERITPSPAIDSPGTAKDCGVEQYGRGEGYDATARECLWQAYTSGNTATFATVRLTTEGARQEFRVRVESRRVQVDAASADRGSAGGNTSYACASLERTAGARVVLVGRNCTGGGSEIGF